MGEPSAPADSGRSDRERRPPIDEQRGPPWRRRVVLAPAAAVVVLFVAGLVVANLPGEGIHPFASLFVGIVWSLAALIVVAAVLGVAIGRLLQVVG